MRAASASGQRTPAPRSQPHAGARVRRPKGRHGDGEDRAAGSHASSGCSPRGRARECGRERGGDMEPQNASAARLIEWLLDNGWTLHSIARTLPTNEQGGIAGRRTLQRILSGEYSGSSLRHRLLWLVETGGTLGDYIPPPPPPLPPPREPANGRRLRAKRAPSRRARRVTRKAPAPDKAPRPSRLAGFWKLLRWGALAGVAVYTLASAYQAVLHEQPEVAVRKQQQQAARAASRKSHQQRRPTSPPSWAPASQPEVPPPSYRMPQPTPQPPAPPSLALRTL